MLDKLHTIKITSYKMELFSTKYNFEEDAF